MKKINPRAFRVAAWVGRAALLSMGLIAMLVLVVLVAVLTPVMLMASATPRAGRGRTAVRGAGGVPESPRRQARRTARASQGWQVRWR
jgi:hypothetical protein